MIDGKSHWLLERMNEFPDALAVVWREQRCTYRDLLGQVEEWTRALEGLGVDSSQCVTINGDCTPKVITLLLALIANRNIIVPLQSATDGNREAFTRIAQANRSFQFDENENWTSGLREVDGGHTILDELRRRGSPGLILFSSGTTGESKAVLHDFSKLLDKFANRRTPPASTLVFLLLDHIGGINTLLHTLSNGGAVVLINDRSVNSVCKAVEQNRVEVLPTSPTFLTMLLMSRAYEKYDLSSLKLITYGTEPMPNSTLERLSQVLPGINFKQTYGLSEIGILSTKSKSKNSLWMKVGGKGFETKVVESTLWVRAESAMVGYLNAESPFDEDGWLNTGDQVEVDGDYLIILGRKTDIINVGGEKVYPNEVESILLKMENVLDVTVYGKSNAITGQVVAARFKLCKGEDLASLRRRVAEFCQDRMARYKMPAFISITDDMPITERYKKSRHVATGKLPAVM